MAIYKVPQDVEAEDKLIGPFGFRQFVYLLIAGAAGGLTYLFVIAPIPIPLFSIFSVPVAIFMIVLALPLRKDQPMEIYIAAIVRFMLKPKRRLWISDGVAIGAVIDAPRFVEPKRSRDISQDQALDRLNYLSRIVDSHGWAAKGVDMPEQTYGPAGTGRDADVTEEEAAIGKSFDDLIAKQKEQSRKVAMERMQQGGQASGTTASAQSQASNISSADDFGKRTSSFKKDGRGVPDQAERASGGKHPRYSPYPTMHQQVLSPVEKLQATTFQSGQSSDDTTRGAQAGVENTQNQGMTPQLSPDIMRLANNNDLSIQTIANEAHRLEQRDEGEVVVELH